ncbi:MAG TPA: hypothetical protein VIE89_33115 [Candidatus Binatia bacterium]
MAKASIIELEETRDYSDGQTPCFRSAEIRGGLAVWTREGLRHRGEFANAQAVLMVQHPFHREPKPAIDAVPAKDVPPLGTAGG